MISGRQFFFGIRPPLLVLLLCALLAGPVPAWAVAGAGTDAQPAAPSAVPAELPQSEPLSPLPANAATPPDSSEDAGAKQLAQDAEPAPSDKEGSAPADAYFSTAHTAEPAPEFSWGNYFFAVGFMFLMLGLLWFAAWFLKKHKAVPGASLFSSGAIRLEAALSLGGRRTVILVRFLNNRYLLGVTDHQITLLKEFDNADFPEEPQLTKGGPFSAFMKKAGQKYDNEGTAVSIRSQSPPPPDSSGSE